MTDQPGAFSHWPDIRETGRQAGTGPLAGEELALGVGREVGQAQQAAVDEDVHHVLDDADQVGVEAGEIGGAGQCGGVRVAVGDFFLVARPGFGEEGDDLAG